MDGSSLSRRQLLALVSAAGGSGLAGCGGPTESIGTATTAPPETASAESTDSTTPTRQDTAAPTIDGFTVDTPTDVGRLRFALDATDDRGIHEIVVSTDAGTTERSIGGEADIGLEGTVAAPPGGPRGGGGTGRRHRRKRGHRDRRRLCEGAFEAA
ncbi:MAG: hypothetical protein U5J98_09140 [Halobacteriales archaeon]|nr:hypothetical protein [Halobacteriales archaeon]